MPETITALWNGKLKPFDCVGRDNEEMRKLTELMCRQYEKLEQGLTKPLREELEAYSECAAEYGALANEQAFCEGIRLGVRLTAEAMLP